MGLSNTFLAQILQQIHKLFFADNSVGEPYRPQVRERTYDRVNRSYLFGLKRALECLEATDDHVK